MASADPPRQDLPIFDPSVFIEQIDGLSQAEADLLYLKFPNAQGTENLQATNVNGVLTANGAVTFAQVGVGSVTSLATQPADTDSTTNVPTTAWVQSAIIAGAGATPTLDQCLTAGNNSGGNEIDMNNNNIINIFDVATQSVNASGTVTANVMNCNDSTITNTITANIMNCNDSTITNTINATTVTATTVTATTVNSTDINYVDTTSQSSAYTGAGALSGSYTASNITLDTDGKITAISNGTGGGGTPTYTTQYTQASDDFADIAVTMPAGVSYISLTAISAGGNSGTNFDINAGAYNCGGTGGGGQLVTNMSIFVKAGDIITFTYPTAQTQMLYTSVTTGVQELLAVLYNGGNGGNASSGSGGTAGLASTATANVNTLFGSWSQLYGLDGTAGVSNSFGTYPTIAVGPISGTGYNGNGDIGTGRLFQFSGGANEPATSTSYIKGGFITYHF